MDDNPDPPTPDPQSSALTLAIPVRFGRGGCLKSVFALIFICSNSFLMEPNQTQNFILLCLAII